MDIGLAGSHVVVAGASRGLGAEVTRILVEEGALVTAVARTARSLDDLAVSVGSQHAGRARIHTVVADLSHELSIDILQQEIADAPSVDGLIVVAGSGRPTGLPPLPAHQAASALNVAPALVSVQACMPRLGQSRHGAVVVVSSVAGVEWIPCPGEYAAAKAALGAYVAHWSREYRPVRVNLLAPGNMMTKGSIWERRHADDPAGLQAWLDEQVTLSRIADPIEVARMAVLLVSPMSSYMTGSTVVVDGGQVRQW